MSAPRRATDFVFGAGLAAAALVVILAGQRLRGAQDVGGRDEREMTYAVLDRFLGVAPTNLAWPASPLQAIGVAVVSADYAVSQHAGATSFVSYLAGAYRLPLPQIRLLRVVVAMFVAVGLAAFAVFAARRTDSTLMGVLIAAAIVTIPAVWAQTRMGTGDGMAAGLALLAVGVAGIAARPAGVAAAGIAFGLAVATKFPTVLVLPVVVALAIDVRGDERPWRVLAAFAGGAAIGLVAGMPYMWVDPLRLVKSVAGNIARDGEPLGLASAIRFAAASFPVWLIVAVLLGAAAMAASASFALALGTLTSLALYLIVTTRAGVLYPRYLVGLAVVAGVSLVALARRWSSTHPVPLWPTVLLLGGIALNVSGMDRREFALSWPTIDRAIEDAFPDGPPTAGVAVWWHDADEAFPYATAESLRRVAAACAGAEARLAAGDGVPRAPLPPSVVQYLPRVLSEREQVCAARALVMSSVPPSRSPAVDLVLWGDDDLAGRFDLLNPAQVVERRRDGRLAAVLSRTPFADLVVRREWPNRLRLY